MPTRPAAQTTSTQDRFAAYDQKWSSTFKDCYIEWLKSEKVPIRRFMLTALLLLLAGLAVLAWLNAHPLAYGIAAMAFLLTQGLSLYLHLIEKRKNQTQPRRDTRGQRTD